MNTNTETPKILKGGENIFRSSSRTKRTPVNSPATTVDVEEHTQRDLETPQCNVVDTLVEGILPTYNSPRLEFIHRMRLSEEEALGKCRNILRKMRVAIGRQRNINLDVQNGVSELDELLDVIADYRKNWKAAEKERELSKANKMQQEKNQDTPIIPPLRNKRSASSPTETNPEKKHKRKASGNHVPLPPSKTQTQDASKNGGGKSGRKRSHHERPKKRSDAVVIKPREGHSYADVLKNLRATIKPEETNVAVQSVRKTKSGSILLVMGKGGRKDEFREAIKGTLKEKAIVQNRRSEATVEIQDLDSLTTEEEVYQATNNVTKIATEDIAVRLTATNSREQKRAFVTLPTADANTLLEQRRILIGWTSCRMRYREEKKRCYKCFEVGHMQWDCKGPDRKGMGLCIRCGQKGHRLKECTNPPKCCVCSQSEGKLTDHLPGSRSCQSTRAL